MTGQIPLGRDSQVVKRDPYDVLIWPDDTWCYAFEAAEYSHMSDDCRRIPYFDAEWLDVTDQMPY